MACADTVPDAFDQHEEPGAASLRRAQRSSVSPGTTTSRTPRSGDASFARRTPSTPRWPRRPPRARTCSRKADGRRPRGAAHNAPCARRRVADGELAHHLVAGGPQGQGAIDAGRIGMWEVKWRNGARWGRCHGTGDQAFSDDGGAQWWHHAAGRRARLLLLWGLPRAVASARAPRRPWPQGSLNSHYGDAEDNAIITVRFPRACHPRAPGRLERYVSRADVVGTWDPGGARAPARRRGTGHRRGTHLPRARAAGRGGPEGDPSQRGAPRSRRSYPSPGDGRFDCRGPNLGHGYPRRRSLGCQWQAGQ